MGSLQVPAACWAAKTGWPGWTTAQLEAFDWTGALLAVPGAEFNIHGWMDEEFPDWKKEHPYLTGYVVKWDKRRLKGPTRLPHAK